MSFCPCLTFYQDAKNLRHLLLSNTHTKKKTEFERVINLSPGHRTVKFLFCFLQSFSSLTMLKCKYVC